MKREELYYTLFEQQKTFQKETQFIPREITPSIISLLESKLPIIITGVRRSGKSTLLWIIKQQLQLKEKEYFYINFNDERFINFSVDDFQKIIDFLRENEYAENCCLFIDEIQEVEKWEKWIDRIKEYHPILITGSNAKLLSKEISTILTGRSLSEHIYPFNFKEFLTARKVELPNIKLDLQEQAKARKMFANYLLIGGFPKAVVENNTLLLKELYENILYRDIIKRFNPNLEKPIKETALWLSSNVGKQISTRSLSRVIEVTNLSTVKSIIDTFEKAFLFFFIPKFDYSLRKQIQNPKKAYCIDTGLVNQTGFRFSQDKGRILENAVFLELKRRKKEIYYFSEKNECDFVIRKGTQIQEAIQVCYNITDENRKRELQGLLEAMNAFKLKKGLILTNDQSEELTIEGKKVIIIPVWKWLLERNEIKS